MTTINLLPWRERRRERSRRTFVGGLAGAFLAALVGVVAGWQWMDGRITDAGGENARLTRHVAEIDARLATMAEVARRNAETETRIATVRDLHAQRIETAGVLDELVRTLPPGLHYTTLARRGGLISVRGTADSESSVSAFLRNVERSARFRAPNLQNIAEGRGNRAAFELTFEVAPPDDADEEESNHEH